MRGISAVIFDYGGVLATVQPAADVARMESLSGLRGERFQELYWGLRIPYDRGDLDGPGYWSAIAREAGRTFAPETVAALVEADTAGWSHPNPPVVAWLERLQREGIVTALLSNMGVELRQHVSSAFPWIARMAQRTFSCDLRSVKPEPAIYRHCLDALGVDPALALFLDDRPANVAGALEVGLPAVLVDSVAGLARRLAEEMALPSLDIEPPARSGN